MHPLKLRVAFPSDHIARAIHGVAWRNKEAEEKIKTKEQGGILGLYFSLLLCKNQGGQKYFEMDSHR